MISQILNIMLLVVDGIVLFGLLQKLVRIPGNKKILRRNKKEESHSISKTSIFLFLAILILTNIIFLKII